MLPAAQQAEPPRALSIAEAARRLDVSRNSVYRLIGAGDLPSFHVGRRHLIPVDAVEALVTPSDDVAELLKRTRTERGMALVIDDPAIIAKVAAIVAAGGEK